MKVCAGRRPSETLLSLLLQPLSLRSVSHARERLLRYHQLPPCDPRRSAPPLAVRRATCRAVGLRASPSLTHSAHHGTAHHNEGRDAKLTNWTPHRRQALVYTNKQFGKKEKNMLKGLG